MYVCLGSVMYGYGASIIGTTLGQPTFIKYMKLDTASNAVQLEGAINGLFQVGGLFGTFGSQYFSDRFGRLKALFVACCFYLLGGVLQTGSAAVGMFIVARFITGVGVVPQYQSEISSPHSRGLLVGFHGGALGIGYCMASWIGVGFFHVHAQNTQWRIPLAIQCILPIILGAGVLFLPESPRWLVQRHQKDRALEVLKRLHHDPSDPDDSFALAEFTQIDRQLEEERHLETGWSSFWKVPANRKRAAMGFWIMFGLQCTGTQVINNYGTLLYSNLGYGSSTQLLLQAGWITQAVIGNFSNAFYMDKFKRIHLFVFGLVMDGIVLIIEMILLSLYSHSTNRAGNQAAVAMLFLHGAFYAFSLDGTSYVYMTEIFPTHLRSKGISISIAGLYIAPLILLTSAPTAFAHIGWKYYIVFVVCIVLTLVFIILVCPETRGMPLEEIAALFGDKVVAHIDETGHVQVEHDEKNAAVALQTGEPDEIEHSREVSGKETMIA
ncbi:hypothetical protein LTR11_010287 [Exophiala xenobiotica]|nr:hypothetical protein LTR11_010287 [Exophiala xenobiotica]KAK5406152.1 hypothetical protein LTR06_008507 [Exophiala xenobiotica]